MLGPGGVSKIYEALRPAITEKQLTSPAANTIISGSRAKFLAAAAGIISIAVISSTPTTLIDTATVTPRPIVKNSCSLLGLKPLA
jgi:hypothetical protein